MAAVFGAVLALAVGTSMAREWLFPAVGAQGTSALRVGFSAALLLLLWRPWRFSRSGRDWKSIALYGAALGCMNLMFYMALRTIPFGIAVAIEFTGPLAVALWSSRRKTDYIWAALAVGGLLLLLPLRPGAQGLDMAGILYAAAAAMCWAAYIVFGKRLGHLHAGHSVALGMLVASLVVVPAGVVHAATALLDARVLLLGVVVAVVSSAIPMSLEMVALKRLPREVYGILTSMEPAVAALVAWLFSGEVLTLLQWLAVALTMAATIGSVLTAARPAAGDRAPPR